MKIGMMCLWNAANGPSIHAELLGRAWVKLGYQLSVFSAKKHPDARPTFQKDEDFVIRHFSVDEVIPVTRATYFDPSPLLNEEYEVFVAQNVERLPAERLLEVFPNIKAKVVIVQVIHGCIAHSLGILKEVQGSRVQFSVPGSGGRLPYPISPVKLCGILPVRGL